MTIETAKEHCDRLNDNARGRGSKSRYFVVSITPNQDGLKTVIFYNTGVQRAILRSNVTTERLDGLLDEILKDKG